ncbi:MAG: 3-phosphoshikimate 1-carboxyvinyltransferase [Planctomycetaceae bacterium]
MNEALCIVPVARPVVGTIRPPGSKSITNRALILAALAQGTSTLTGVLDSQDTRVMLESLQRLGLSVTHDADAATCEVVGCGGKLKRDRSKRGVFREGEAPAEPLPPTASNLPRGSAGASPSHSDIGESNAGNPRDLQSADLWLENSGTSIRFLTSLCALGTGRYRLDGVERMRQRPIGDLVHTLNLLGAFVECEHAGSECPPVIVDGSLGRLSGGTALIRGDISSQFLSSLLMSAPAAAEPIELTVDGDLVSKPYVTMTVEMMRSFGVEVAHPPDLSSFLIEPQSYTGRRYEIEPDASAASYFFAVAAVTGGEVTVTGLSRNALQGDIHFVDALQQMGCEVRWAENSVTVIGRPLHGIDIDMNQISDTAQTLAVAAVFADSPTRIRNVEHMRHKETDRVSAVVNELRRAGIKADEFDDGLTIHPGQPQPADVSTYDDHRMAMSFSLLGLKAAGIRILDPGCTAKTYPNYFEDLDALCREARK